MGNRKIIKKLFQCWESFKDNGRFIKFAADMQHTKFEKTSTSETAWEQLTLSQIGLYHILKSKYYKKEDENNISMPKSEWSRYYSRKPAFDKDMDILIEL